MSDKHPTSNNHDQNRSCRKLKTFSLRQQRSRAQNHNNTNALFSINARTGLPTLVVSEEDDPNFRLKKPSSAEKLLETWKNDQKYLEHFWKIWKDDYLLSLRERSQIYKRHPRKQSKQERRVGDVVQIQENTPRGSWKIGRIIELIKS